MIHAVNFTGSRDYELSCLMIRSFSHHCPVTFTMHSVNMDNEPWGNGAGWEAAMLKFNAFKKVAKAAFGGDWILSVDSDVCFCRPDIFEFVLNQPREIGICGILQSGELADCKMGKLRNFSGCLIFIRKEIADKMCEVDVEMIRKDFKAFNICENEDVVLSYIAQFVGANYAEFPQTYYNSDKDPSQLDQDINERRRKSFYHLQMWPGIVKLNGNEYNIDGKWDFPQVLRKAGLDKCNP